jgi:two-component system cell cycle sensor histidine kinase/response regulator CckA
MTSSLPHIPDSEMVFRRLADSFPGFCWLLSLAPGQPRLVYASPAAEPFWEWCRQKFQAEITRFPEIIHPEDALKMRQVWGRLLQGQKVSEECRLLGPAGEVKRVTFQAAPLDPENSPPQLLAGFCLDQATCLLRCPAEAALAWEARINAALAELSHAVIDSASPDDLSRLVLAKAKELTGSAGGSVAYFDWRSRELVFPDPAEESSENVHCSGWHQEGLDWSARWARCLAERRPLLINAPSDPAGQARPYHRFICVPAVFRDRLMGQIALDTSTRDYEARDLEALERLASLFAIALERQQAEEALREKEERFRSLVEAISDLVWETDAEGRLTFISPNVQDLLGYAPAEILGKTFLELLDKDEAERMGELLSPILEARKPYVYVGKTIRHKCGKRVVLESSGVPIVDSRGTFLGFRGIDRNITERHRAAEAMYREKEKYRTLVEESPLGVAIISETGDYKYINPMFVKIFGYTLEDVPTGREWFCRAFPEPAYRQGIIANWFEDLATSKLGEARLRTYTVTCKDGSRKIINFRPVTLMTGDQLVIYEDITEHHRAVAALQESEAKYRLLVNNIPAVVFRGYADWSVEFFDDKVEELTGYPKEDFNSGLLKWSDLILPEDLVDSRRIFSQALKTSGAYTRQYRIRHKKGHILWIQARGQIIRDSEQRIDHVYGVFFDITKQKEIEDDLAAEKERLRVTLRSIGEGVIATDTAGNVVLMNQVAEALTGWTQEEALGRPVARVLSLVHELTRKPCDNRVEKVIRTGKVVRLPAHAMLLARDGAERLLAASAAPIIDQAGQVIGVVLVFQDITVKRQTEAELQKMEKLTSLGILAGGIAHDFNNILTGILGNISLAMLTTPQQEEVTQRLVEAEQATLRARGLVQQLLTFAKGGAPVKEVASLGEIIRESATFACRGSQVRCDFTWPMDLWPAEVDPGQISQVIQNLVINAIQAMPTGGAITITAENITLQDDQGLPLPPGRYVKIKVRDQGIGIPPDYLPKIFDPYFSTKQKGSGLGLATAYSIIKNHDGYMTVESTLGKGTTFSLYLAASSQKIKSIPRSSVALLHTGSGRILVMDDDPGVRQVAGKILTHLGYEVDYASDGATAIDKYQEAIRAGRPFDLVIMDLTIPGGMGGQETIQALLKIEPGTRAIVSSGYADDPIMTNYQDHGFVGVIKKPYKISTFSHVLHEILGREGG